MERMKEPMIKSNFFFLDLHNFFLKLFSQARNLWTPAFPISVNDKPILVIAQDRNFDAILDSSVTLTWSQSQPL